MLAFDLLGQTPVTGPAVQAVLKDLAFAQEFAAFLQSNAKAVVIRGSTGTVEPKPNKVYVTLDFDPVIRATNENTINRGAITEINRLLQLAKLPEIELRALQRQASSDCCWDPSRIPTGVITEPSEVLIPRVAQLIVYLIGPYLAAAYRTDAANQTAVTAAQAKADADAQAKAQAETQAKADAAAKMAAAITAAAAKAVQRPWLPTAMLATTVVLGTGMLITSITMLRSARSRRA